MRIGIISDTHDHISNAETVIELLSEMNIDLLCHLGDWVAPFTVNAIAVKARQYDIPIKGVLGNNDGDVFSIIQNNPHEWGISLAQQTLAFDADGKHVVLYHGTDEIMTDALVESGKYDAIFTGHTHVPVNQRVGSTLLLNPGTLSGFSLPRGGEISVGEYALYDTDTDSVDMLRIAI